MIDTDSAYKEYTCIIYKIYTFQYEANLLWSWQGASAVQVGTPFLRHGHFSTFSLNVTNESHEKNLEYLGSFPWGHFVIW